MILMLEMNLLCDVCINTRLDVYSLETRLVKIFEETRKTYENIESRIKAEGFRTRVMQILKAWSDWAIYPREFLIKIQNTFLGLSPHHVSQQISKFISIFFHMR